jgi:uncharacterized protein (DUF697 family)
MARDIDSVIRRTGIIAGAIAAAMPPIPLLDEVLLLPLYVIFTKRIGQEHGLRFRQIPWKPIAQTGVAGIVARNIINLGVTFVPGVAQVVKAATTFALTEVFGRYIDGACADPVSATPLKIKDFIHLLRNHPRAQAAVVN